MSKLLHTTCHEPDYSKYVYFLKTTQGCKKSLYASPRSKKGAKAKLIAKDVADAEGGNLYFAKKNSKGVLAIYKRPVGKKSPKKSPRKAVKRSTKVAKKASPKRSTKARKKASPKKSKKRTC